MIILFIAVLLAQCCPTGASQESTEVSSSDPGIKPGSGGKWRVYVFCEEGLYGENLNFKMGTWGNCEIPAAHSYSTVTCDDKSMGILVSDKCAALITKHKQSVFFEWKGITVKLSINETFSDQKDAVEYALAQIFPNPNSNGTMKQNDKTPETGHNNYYLWIIIAAVVGVLVGVLVGIAIADCRFIQRCKKKCWSSKRPSSLGENVELNAPQR